MTQTIIPAGYRVTIESWENDADNYKTKVVEGLNESSVKFIIDFVKLFYSKNNYHGPKGFGNIYDPSDKELKELAEAYNLVINKHINKDTENNVRQYFWDDDADGFYEDHHDGVFDLAYDLGLSGGCDFFTRVLDSFKVEHVPVEIILQDVTEEFK
jgi:hypothetical protein